MDLNFKLDLKSESCPANTATHHDVTYTMCSNQCLPQITNGLSILTSFSRLVHTDSVLMWPLTVPSLTGETRHSLLYSTLVVCTCLVKTYSLFCKYIVNTCIDTLIACSHLVEIYSFYYKYTVHKQVDTLIYR